MEKNKTKKQPFWPALMTMLTERPVLLSARETLLTQPSDMTLRHPLRKKNWPCWYAKYPGEI